MVDDDLDSNEGIELNVASNNSNDNTTASDTIPSNHETEVGIPEENNNVLFTDDLTDRNDEFKDAEYDDDALLVDKQIINTLDATEEDFEFYKIQSHNWQKGMLVFTMELTSGQTYEVPFSLFKKNRPIETAR